MKIVGMIFVLFVVTLYTDTPQYQLSDPCPSSSPDWIEFETLPDSLQVPPGFFFEQPTVPIDRLIVCTHGIFFNFRASEDGTSTEYWVSFPIPTYDEYEKYFLEEQVRSVPPVLNPDSIRREVETRVAIAAGQYSQLTSELRKFLVGRYDEDQIIDLTGDPAKLRLEFPLVFVWDTQAMPFETYPGIYQHRVGRTVQ